MALESDVVAPSALLPTLEESARKLIAVGFGAVLVGALLLAWLSSNPIAVVLGGAVVVACPVLLSGKKLSVNQVLPGLLALLFFMVVMPVAHGWGLSKVGRIIGAVDLLLGPSLLWGAWRSRGLVDSARASLNGPVFEVRLQVAVRRGYMGVPYTEARLWRLDSDAQPPLAQFGFHQSTCIADVDKIPAQVHGTPIKGSVVAVSSSEMALIGRVRRSHFGEAPSPPKEPSALVAWLWKPRSLRIR
jgi:hypothetical protein